MSGFLCSFLDFHSWHIEMMAYLVYNTKPELQKFVILISVIYDSVSHFLFYIFSHFKDQTCRSLAANLEGQIFPPICFIAAVTEYEDKNVDNTLTFAPFHAWNECRSI
jgi:hypothetical protein